MIQPQSATCITGIEKSLRRAQTRNLITSSNYLAAMSAWNDPDRWSALCSGTGCPICLGGQPLDLIAEFEAESAATAFMQAARQASAALTIATRPVKMNVFQALSGSSCRQGARARFSFSVTAYFGNSIIQQFPPVSRASSARQRSIRYLGAEIPTNLCRLRDIAQRSARRSCHI